MGFELIQKARANRNAALIDAMLLAASADGVLKESELTQLVARVVERPEFEGTTADELTAQVEASAARLAQARSLEAIVESLRERLPEHRLRLLAFGLACAVALADHAAKAEELSLLKVLQKALGISEAEVERCFITVQRGGSLSDVVGEPPERLYAEVMVLVTAADGRVEASELSAMLEQMAGDPVFRELSMPAAEVSLATAAQALATEGAPARLEALAKGLTTRSQRLKAFTLGARVAWANGGPSDATLRTLDLLQATFGLADDEVQRILRER